MLVVLPLLVAGLAGCARERGSREARPAETTADRALEDTVNTLPPNVRAELDARFAAWRTAAVTASEWMWADPPMSPVLIWGDFDGDGERDWAAQIVAERDGARERSAYLFLDRGDTTEAILLFRGGTDLDALCLFAAGEEYFDSTGAGWRRVRRDAVGVVRGDSAFVYEIEADATP